MSPSLAPADLLNRVERDVQRALQRSRNGLRYAAGTQRPKVGRTPKDVVWRRHKSELWRYRSDTRRYRPPLVIVHSLVSRSYVLDLYPGNSAVEHFLREGLDVFLLDWGVPDETDAGNTLEYYVDDGIPEAVAAACETAGTDDVNLLGYCFGGVLSLLSAARHPELPIRNLAAMATPVDFSQMETITALVRANGLVNGTFELGGERVDLKSITRPVLNIMAERDHIVPLAAAEPLLGLVGSKEKEELRLAAGHAGLVAGRKAAKVTLPGIAGWFKDHSEPTTSGEPQAEES